MGTLTINLSKPGKPISPMLYGIFFEDINRAADGGLYGNLVANGSFDYTKDEHGTDMSFADWETVGDARTEIQNLTPVNKENPHYIHISSLKGGGIRNKGFGYDGFGVRAKERYKLSFQAKTEGSALLSFCICACNRQLTQESVEINGNTWKNYTLFLTSPSDEPHAELAICFPDGGQADIDCITMFPEHTFKRRNNGMREDIAHMIADLKPKFMRFPGGCVVEGRSIETMYRWKDSIGDTNTRHVNNNRWQMDEYQKCGKSSQDYFQTLGLGFYEYFLFCEDIGAEPVPVVNCGMTCQWHEAIKIPLNELRPWIDDVLDLIEFANGSADTKWGAKRTELGHPEPFHLTYIGIGNEQWGTEYFERYEKFYEAISEQYPDIRLITSAGFNSEGTDFDTAMRWISSNKEKAFAVDEHFYKSPEWFLSNVHRYDDYNRAMPKVFAGEYACHTVRDINERRANFYAALCEAAFMTGLENNADHVWMACYAPLLEKAGFEQWRPNLIRFDNLNVYGTPSYYVQKEFSTHYGSELLQTNCEMEGICVSATIDKENLYLKMVNVSDKETALTLHTPGGMIDDIHAKLRILHADLNAENSFETPSLVSALTETRHIKSGDTITLPPYSIFILTVNRRP